MPDGNTYGERLGATFRVENAPTLVTRALRKADIAVTEVRALPDFELSTPLPEDDAYIVGLQLHDYGECESWEAGRPANKTVIRRGETHIYDLHRNPQFVMVNPVHFMGFYIPRAVFDAVAREARAPGITDLDYSPGIGRDDQIMRGLGGSLLAAFERPEQANKMFLDHITLAVAGHVAQAYGGLRRMLGVRGGLAGWQVRRACELLNENLDGALALKDVAAECGLSVSHFSRAFRESLGVAPHRWLLQRRVDVAQALLANRRMSLSEVALSAGFADQSHFTRVFSKAVGVSPGVWRRNRNGA